MKETTCEAVLMAAMAAADGQPSTMETAQIEAHLASCAACRGELEALAGVVKMFDERKRRQSDEDLWRTLEPRLLDRAQVDRKPAGDINMWIPIGLILLVYKLFEQIPDRHLATAYKLVPLLLVTAVFFFLKQNPFRINTELKLEGE